MTVTKFKLSYEPPKILDLGGGVAYAGKHCRTGSVPGGQCQAGGAAASAKCQAGGSPQKKCQAGSVAYGGFCKSGSVAGKQCQAGSVPTKEKKKKKAKK